ncbi:hypothetical protein Taro_050786 [Colocasia esculenta]|uniref:GDSL esterase/lipase n=1 Tax=Colocasia esculenta TaxID=4460 RepID=A0A843XF71_COLES|nr:hypothetical protein [Colocasia esculenta]
MYSPMKAASMAGRWSCVLATLLLSFVTEKTTWRAEGKTVPPGLFVFGDSILDVGNNNFLTRTTAKANFPPNGMDFPGGKPTGRFSNGYNAADYLAQQYGFDASPPAFFSLSQSQLRTSICKGINFASGGSGILASTGTSLVSTHRSLPFRSFSSLSLITQTNKDALYNPAMHASTMQGGAISMDAQLDNFKNSLKSFSAGRCSATKGDFLSKSIFLLSAGSNDLFGLYRSNSTTTQTSEFITSLASKYGTQLTTLYGYGARRFGILGLSLIGCCPSFRRLNTTGDCIAALDDYALQFNKALSKVLKQFVSAHAGVKYSVGDGLSIGKLIADNPLKYGFKEFKSACCGSGKFNGESACTQNATLCSDRDDHFFWDFFHPTASTAKLQVRLLFGSSPSVANPINFGGLVG